MVFQKIIAAAIGILVIWVMFPHAKKGEFLAPNPLPPGTWLSTYDRTGYSQALSSPEDGYGFRSFDFRNNTTQGGRPATKEDFELRW